MGALWKRPGHAAIIAALAAALAVVLWGGYGHHWPWTGISGQTASLWDWLHLLLLPIAFGILPIVLSPRAQLRRHHKLLGVAAIALFALIAVAGYMVPWQWTGFQGNRLWDWLELLALPLAVAMVPIMPRLRKAWDSRHSAIAAASLAVFVAIVIGGYVGNWSWTGFRGNTLWDWLHLLLLPLLLPTVIVPALVPVASSRLIVIEEDELADELEAVEPAEPLAEAQTLGQAHPVDEAEPGRR
jgi:hypothetical protein